jgi:hypothetical protein
MFQTNQGPSFPAHQFLFTGTSAPIQYNDPNDPCISMPSEFPCWEWFDEEGVTNTGNSAVNGCIAVAGAYAYQIDPNSHEALLPNPLGFSSGFPCYDHPTLSDLLEGGNPRFEWKYYGRAAGDIWTAPNAINHICMPSGYGGNCQGSSWGANVAAVLPTKSDAAPFLTDITNCNLSHVSWVIPDGNWSDHNQAIPGDGGPSWVAAIVNGIGQSPCTDLVNGVNVPYWQDSVILITWDDWGGLYDDVLPPDCPPLQPCTGYANSGSNPPNGQQYVYGFRVPLLVVSAYAKRNYISGANAGAKPDCLHNTYCHDFGSILNFIEYAFGTGGQPLGSPYGIGTQNWPYADYFAPDGHFEQPSNPYSLYDFFDFKQIQTPTFTPIAGAKYQPNCFHNPTAQGCFELTYPSDPDNDANED